MKQARFFSSDGETVSCFLCRHFCKIKKGETGKCGVRKNVDGTLYSLVYGKVASMAVDPIEKKPFYHFLPGTYTLSFSTVGCNFDCQFCQNWELSHPQYVFGHDYSVAEIIELATRYEVDTIAYTYNEPTVFMEFALDVASAAKSRGLYNVFVTNGYESDAAIAAMRGLIDAARIDVKAFNERTYREVVGAELDEVLKAVRSFFKVMPIELIYLVIPGVNDSEDEVAAFVQWVKDKLSQSVPIHFTAFYPAFKMQHVPPTPLSTLLKLRALALDMGMEYVYTGNRFDWRSESTYCPHCSALVVKRQGFEVKEVHLKKKGDAVVCGFCGAKLNFVLK